MPESSRQLAVRILAAYVPEVTNLSHLINTVLSQHGRQCPDKGFARALVWGTVRRLNTIDYIANAHLKDPRHTDALVRAILRVGLYQLLFMGDRVPPYAAVNESVALARTCHKAKAAGMINAVMRRVSEQPEILARFSQDAAENMALKYSFPHWLIKRWFGRFGITETELMCIANNDPGYLTLRTNTLKVDRTSAMAAIPNEYAPVPARYGDEGIQLEAANPELESLAGISDGSLVVQDEASQLVGVLVQPQAGQMVLDMCCGSGTKTAHIAARARNQCTITAVDADKKRIAQAADTFARLGVTCVQLAAQDSTAVAGCFDTVLLDAPCSGLGTLRKKPDIKWNRTPSDITTKNPAVQRSLLNHAATLVKDGGVLVYSVCTVEPEETNDVIDAFLHAHPSFVLESLEGLVPVELLSQDRRYLRTWPHKHNMDGFFAVRMKKSLA